MRPSPTLSPISTKRNAQTGEKRQYKFLTYVFGGGVKVREHEKYADPVTPVRVASVRGQLRFWWRACNPRSCDTVEALRYCEGEIWGTTSQASKVEISVVSQPGTVRSIPVYQYNDKKRLVVCPGMNEIAYGAFPLQPSRDEQKKRAHPGVLYDYGNAIFTLRFTYPEDYQEDVKAALWAWETFGGLGGRTRRGFGAITRVDGQDGISVEQGLSEHRDHPRIPGIPSLRQARFVASNRTNENAVEAWKASLRLLQQLRQERGFGRNDPPKDSKKPAGRSRWPEPDEIRRLTGQSAPAHQHPVVSVSRFPRARFGMPIVFHFHPGSPDEPGSSGDPAMKPLQLQPVGFERFASPLIIRPIPVGAKYRAAALVLVSDHPPAELVAGAVRHNVDTVLDASFARKIQPLNRNGKVFTDPIDLYLSELAK